MTAYTDVQIGSIVYSWISNIPVGISGILPVIVDQQIISVETFTGKSVGTTAIAEVYQPAIFSLTISNVLKAMEAQGVGIKSVSIGDLSITKGMSEGTSREWKEWGMEQLNQIGQHMSFYQCWG